MPYIPCSLDCVYQNDGECSLTKPAEISLESEKCPHFKSKKAESNDSAYID